ncbi:MAG: hypothetical protein MUC92_10565 [Fimbriimonadaceae bacterium]|jgi:hypothetical protein|nr:hypothetical protein [Fimbriimonadaceae bacterium]
MKWVTVPRVLTTLVLLLVVSSILFFITKEPRATNPSINNQRPSGLAAFAELLRADGYPVVLDRSGDPNPRTDELIIRVQLRQEGIFGQVNAPRPPPVSFDRSLNLFQQGGGKILDIWLNPDFEEITSMARAKEFSDKKGNKLMLTTSQSVFERSLGTGGYPLAFNRDSGALATADITLTTATYSFWDGTLFTNRFIGQQQNAQFILDSIRTIHPKGATVRFVEAAFGQSDEKGLIGTLGPWAVALQWQVILLVGLIIYTLSISFGKARDVILKARGTRELFDAMGDIMLRANQDQFSLKALIDASYERVRLATGAPLGTKPPDLLKRKPDSLIKAFHEAETAWRDETTKPAECVAVAKALDQAVTQFEKDSRDIKAPPQTVK